MRTPRWVACWLGQACQLLTWLSDDASGVHLVGRLLLGPPQQQLLGRGAACVVAALQLRQPQLAAVGAVDVAAAGTPVAGAFEESEDGEAQTPSSEQHKPD